MENKLPIIEIFSSIQGEGTGSGVPVTFIRTAGCNLKCAWCDTKYSWDADQMKGKVVLMTIEEIAEKVTTDTVVITGGEPTLHDLKPLCDLLHMSDKFIAIETNGTNTIPNEWCIDWVTCSPKPQSNYVVNCQCDELKYVVDDNFDPIVIKHNPQVRRVYLQVESARKESAQRAFDMVMKDERLRLGVQLHKVLNVL